MRPAVAVLAIALALPLPSLAAEVRVQPGETLSEIADRLGVSVKRLVEMNNIADPDHLEAGTPLRLPAGVGARASTAGRGAGGTTVTVGAGETLSDIADRHGISVSTLIALNSLSNPNHVEVGQVLKLKGSPRAAAPKAAAAPTPTYNYTPGASAHVVRKGESLSAIARGYGVPLTQLVALNAIANPNNVPAGSTLKLIGTPAAATPAAAAPVTQPRPEPRPIAKPQPKPQPAATTVAAAPRPAATPVKEAASGKSDWLTYGPLQVDWTSWQPMGGSMVAAMVNGKGESLYTAINCGARKINSTNGAGQWGTWNDPTSEVETKLVNDFCSRRGA